MGRPTVLTDELRDRFAEEVRGGLPITYCCDLLGVLRDYYNRWMREGEEDAKLGEDTAFCAFYKAIKNAYAEFIKEAKRTIRKGEHGWQGTAWWLERTNKDFMPKQQIQADDEGKVTVVIGGREKQVKPVTAAEAERMRKQHADDQGR